MLGYWWCTTEDKFICNCDALKLGYGLLRNSTLYCFSRVAFFFFLLGLFFSCRWGSCLPPSVSMCVGFMLCWHKGRLCFNSLGYLYTFTFEETLPEKSNSCLRLFVFSRALTSFKYPYSSVGTDCLALDLEDVTTTILPWNLPNRSSWRLLKRQRNCFWLLWLCFAFCLRSG